MHLHSHRKWQFLQWQTNRDSNWKYISCFICWRSNDSHDVFDFHLLHNSHHLLIALRKWYLPPIYAFAHFRLYSKDVFFFLHYFRVFVWSNIWQYSWNVSFDKDIVSIVPWWIVSLHVQEVRTMRPSGFVFDEWIVFFSIITFKFRIFLHPISRF